MNWWCPVTLYEKQTPRPLIVAAPLPSPAALLLLRPKTQQTQQLLRSSSSLRLSLRCCQLLRQLLLRSRASRRDAPIRSSFRVLGWNAAAQQLLLWKSCYCDEAAAGYDCAAAGPLRSFCASSPSRGDVMLRRLMLKRPAFKLPPCKISSVVAHSPKPPPSPVI